MYYDRFSVILIFCLFPELECLILGQKLGLKSKFSVVMSLICYESEKFWLIKWPNYSNITPDIFWWMYTSVWDILIYNLFHFCDILGTLLLKLFILAAFWAIKSEILAYEIRK